MNAVALDTTTTDFMPRSDVTGTSQSISDKASFSSPAAPANQESNAEAPLRSVTAAEPQARIRTPMISVRRRATVQAALREAKEHPET